VRLALLVLLVSACASQRLLPAPPAAEGLSPLPLRYEQTRLFFSSTRDDLVVDRIFTAPGAAVLAAVARPEPALLASADGGATFAFASTSGALVRAVYFDPRDGRRAYAIAQQWLLRSDDGGQSWARCEPAERLDALTVAPDGAVYVASGAALFASDDGARTWRRLPLPISGPAARVRTLVADPAAPGTLHASIEPPGRPGFAARLASLVDGTAPDAVEALGLAASTDAAARTFSWEDRRGGVWTTRDRGGLWQRSGLSIDSWLLFRDGALYAAPAEPLLEAAALARRSPALAAAVVKQLRGSRPDMASLRPALAWPGRESLLAGGPWIVFRSGDGGATWSRVVEPDPALLFDLRESVDRQRAARVELPPEARRPQRREGAPQRRGRGRRGRAPPPQQEGAEPQGPSRREPVEPLLALFDPQRLLARTGGLASLSGVARGGSGLYGFAPTEAGWKRLAELLVTAGELGGGAIDVPPEPGSFELLRSGDSGKTWAPIPSAIDVPAAYPVHVGASASQAYFVLTSRPRGGVPWRGVWRYVPAR